MTIRRAGFRRTEQISTTHFVGGPRFLSVSVITQALFIFWHLPQTGLTRSHYWGKRDGHVSVHSQTFSHMNAFDRTTRSMQKKLRSSP